MNSAELLTKNVATCDAIVDCTLDEEEDEDEEEDQESMHSSMSPPIVLRANHHEAVVDSNTNSDASSHHMIHNNDTNTNLSSQSNHSSKNKKLFPQKLWDLINDHKYHFCLRWSDDGQLVYLNRDEFEDSYLKTAANQFHTQKAISFVRQMNMYGFRKVDDCFYENDNFKRGCEHLLKNMIRKHPNKNQPLAASAAGTGTGTGTGTSSSCAASAVLGAVNGDFSSFLYRATGGSHHRAAAGQSASAGLDSLQVSPPPTAASQLLDTSIIPNGARPMSLADFASFRQRLVGEAGGYQQGAYPSTTRASPQQDRNAVNKLSPQHNSQRFAEDVVDKLNDDSLSSFGDYCCNVTSGSQSEPLGAAIDSSGKHDLHGLASRAARQARNKQTQQASSMMANQWRGLQDDSSLFSDSNGVPTINHLGGSLKKGQFLGDPLGGGSSSIAANCGMGFLPTSTSAIGAADNFEKSYIPQSVFNDQKDIIKALLTQQQQQQQLQPQTHSRFARDLNDATSPATSAIGNCNIDPNSARPQPQSLLTSPENNNLGAFYALLSSINSNLYPTSLPIQSNPSQNMSLDLNLNNHQKQLTDLQQIYRHVLDQANPFFVPHQQQVEAVDSLNLSNKPPMTDNSRNEPNSLKSDSTPDSSVIKLTKTPTTGVYRSTRGANGSDNNHGVIGGLRDRPRDDVRSSSRLNKWSSDSEYHFKRRNGNKSTRSFKRSADSILDSNNNDDNDCDLDKYQGVIKRVKATSRRGDEACEILADNHQVVNKNAKNLVIQVALARGMKIDSNAIHEASRYAERFVEVLFETAQVIARHSNGSSSSDSTSIESQIAEEFDLNFKKEFGGSAINLGDLTSAIKLLPSKMPKILK